MQNTIQLILVILNVCFLSNIDIFYRIMYIAFLKLDNKTSVIFRDFSLRP